MSAFGLESVEARRLFSDLPGMPPNTPDGVLVTADRVLLVSGSDTADDTAVLTRPDAHTIRVVLNGQTTNIDTNQTTVDEAIISLGNGNNSLDDSVTLRNGLTAYAGRGNDTLTTTDGSDTVYDDGGNNIINTRGGFDSVSLNTVGNHAAGIYGGNDTVDLGADGGTLGGTGLPGNVVTVSNTSGVARINWFGAGSIHATLVGSVDQDPYVFTGDGDDIIDVSGISIPMTVSTGEGNDSIIGNDAGDTIVPGSGNDTVHAGSGDDFVLNADKDSYFKKPAFTLSEPDNDLYDLGAGNDRLNDNNGNNTVVAGAGDDTVRTGSGDDNIDGGLGRDIIHANGGNDTLIGGGGRDRLFGQDGDDLIYGVGNSDTLVGGTGSDTLFAGIGDDLVVANDYLGAADNTAHNTIDGGPGNDRYALESVNDTQISLETSITNNE